MLETAVKEDSDIAIFHKGKQQNNAVLGNGGAIFLAKFLSVLILKYAKYCDQANLDYSQILETTLYKYALEDALHEIAYDDMNEHGHLLILKEKLIKLMGHNKPDIKTLALFQLKDICRNDRDLQEEIKKDIKLVKITSKDAIKAMDYRQANMVYPNAKLIQEGGDNIDGEIDRMREAILKKEDIVPQEAQQDFHFFIKNCMTRQLLDQIGGEMNSFSTNSFRLNQLNVSGGSNQSKICEKTSNFGNL